MLLREKCERLDREYSTATLPILDELESRQLVSIGSGNWTPNVDLTASHFGAALQKYRRREGTTLEGIGERIKRWDSETGGLLPTSSSSAGRWEKGTVLDSDAIVDPFKFVQFADLYRDSSFLDDCLRSAIVLRGDLPQRDLEGKLSLLKVAMGATKDAGVWLARRDPEGLVVTSGLESRTLDLRADMTSHEIIRAYFQTSRRDDGDAIFGESAPNEDVLAQLREGQIVWIIDSLDGTIPYWMNQPLYCSQVACAQFDGRQLVDICSAIYVPKTREMFVGLAGGGALLFDDLEHSVRPLTPSMEMRPFMCVLGTHFTASDEAALCDFVQNEFTNLCLSSKRIEAIASGGLALAWLADGRMHLFANKSTKFWDAYPGKILNDAAGGPLVTAWDGQPWNRTSKGIFAASTAEMHTTFQRILRLRRT